YSLLKNREGRRPDVSVIRKIAGLLDADEAINPKDKLKLVGDQQNGGPEAAATADNLAAGDQEIASPSPTTEHAKKAPARKGFFKQWTEPTPIHHVDADLADLDKELQELLMGARTIRVTQRMEEEAKKLQLEWDTDPRWEHVERPYKALDVVR